MRMATESPSGGGAVEGLVLVERLGRGSVFEVARVRSRSGQELILKRPSEQAGDDGRSALARERKILESTLVRTGHTPLLALAGQHPSEAFVVETVAPGRALRDVTSSGPLGASEWASIAASCSRALATLHSARDEFRELHFTHGDISPDNLFFDEKTGIATFIDFSNATYTDGKEPVFPSARGTLPYVAPEIARSEHHADQATDTYALAATLLFLATGPLASKSHEASRLFEIGTRGLAAHELLARRRDLASPARRAIIAALEFTPSARLRSAAGLARELAM